MARPFWSGQIQISLVSFGVKLFPATDAKSEIRFHQVSRKGGDRVRHQNVSSADDAPVEKEDIVKGYEYSKGEYIQIDPEEIEHLRIASKHTLEIQQFVDVDELNPAMYEKPYFVTPENDTQAEAFGVVRKALQETKKCGLGKIALNGRERLVAISANDDDKLPGLMAYVLRFPAELRNSSEYFAGVKAATIDPEQLSLAKELIQRKTATFDPSKFTDNYEAALRELIDAKLKHVSLPEEPRAAARTNVVDLMDALRRSVSPSSENKFPVRATSAKAKSRATKHGLTLLDDNSKSADKRRKSA